MIYYKLSESRIGREPAASSSGRDGSLATTSDDFVLFSSVSSCAGASTLSLMVSSLFKSRDGRNSLSLSSSPIFFIMSHRRLARVGG